jgi:hypothetical protein
MSLSFNSIHGYLTNPNLLARDKHASLLCPVIGDEVTEKARVFVPGEPSQPSILFTSKARSQYHKTFWHKFTHFGLEARSFHCTETIFVVINKTD